MQGKVRARGFLLLLALGAGLGAAGAAEAGKKAAKSPGGGGKKPKKPYALVETPLADGQRGPKLLNDKGQVLGQARKGGGPVVWADGKATPIEVPQKGDLTGLALAINEAGQVVGSMPNTGDASAGKERGFLWSAGQLVDLHDRKGFRPRSLNGKGQLVGYTFQNGDGNLHCAIVDGAEVRDLGTFGKGEKVAESCIATDINDHGQVVGYTDHVADKGHRAFLWDGGKKIDVGPPGWSEALAINNHGDVVGIARDAGGGTRAFLWSKGKVQPLKGMIEAFAINDARQIVGVGLRKWEQQRYAALWHKGQLRELNRLVPKATWHLAAARSINQRGEILATGVPEGGGQARAFLVRPTE